MKSELLSLEVEGLQRVLLLVAEVDEGLLDRHAHVVAVDLRHVRRQHGRVLVVDGGAAGGHDGAELLAGQLGVVGDAVDVGEVGLEDLVQEHLGVAWQRPPVHGVEEDDPGRLQHHLLLGLDVLGGVHVLLVHLAELHVLQRLQVL